MRPILIPALLLLAPFAQAQTMPRPWHGETVTQNIQAQAGDMNPAYRGTEIEGGNGPRSVAAVNRYEKGRIIQPRGVTASGAAIEQGGGGGDGGAPAATPRS